MAARSFRNYSEGTNRDHFKEFCIHFCVRSLANSKEEREQLCPGDAGFYNKHPHNSVGKKRARREQEFFSDVGLIGDVDHDELALLVDPGRGQLRDERGQVRGGPVHARVRGRAHLGGAARHAVVLRAARAEKRAPPRVHRVPGINSLMFTISRVHEYL